MTQPDQMRKALTDICQRANESRPGEMGAIDTIHAMHAIATAALTPSRPVTAEPTEIPFNILLTEDDDPISTPPTATGREEMARVVCQARGYDLATEQHWAAKNHAASINIVRDAFNVADAVLALSPHKLGVGGPVAWLVESPAGKEAFLYKHNADHTAAVQKGRTIPLYATPPEPTKKQIEAGAKAIARMVPTDSGRWNDGFGHDFPREYSENERRLIRAIAETCIDATLPRAERAPE